MATYNKDYSHKTAEEWLAERKWTGFLMTLPLRVTRDYAVQSIKDAMSIRTTASSLSQGDECDRTFKVSIDFDTKKVFITATKKK